MEDYDKIVKGVMEEKGTQSIKLIVKVVNQWNRYCTETCVEIAVKKLIKKKWPCFYPYFN
jgi:hypothetical protein